VRTRLVAWLRAPVLHFLVGGAALFVLVDGRPPAVGASDAARVEPVVVTAADVARLRTDYARETGIQPTAADEAALVEHAIDEELLFREAVARGLDRHDPSVRNWLVQQMAVLAPDRAGDADGLYARARALGLDRTDLVVRHIVVQQMRLLAGRSGERGPSDAELRGFYARHRDAYRPPDRVTLRHVFVSSETHGAATAAAAAALLDALRRSGAGADAVDGRGDAFPFAPRVVGQSAAQIAKVFGSAFAERIATAPVGRWIGPVPSAYGMHLVWIEAREAGTPPPLSAVRGQVVERWQQEQRAARVDVLLRTLRARYPIEVASAAWRDRRRS
jgi:hypothetical protein